MPLFILTVVLPALLLISSLFLPMFIPHRPLVITCIAIILSCPIAGAVIWFSKKAFFPLISLFHIFLAALLCLILTCRYSFVGSASTPMLIGSTVFSAILSAFLTFRLFFKKYKLPALIGMFLIFQILLSMVSFSLIAHANYVFDTNPPLECKAVIEDKDINSHHKSADTYDFTVTINGEKTILDVSRNKYQTLEIGDIYVFYQHQGAFNIPFYFEE